TVRLRRLTPRRRFGVRLLLSLISDDRRRPDAAVREMSESKSLTPSSRLHADGAVQADGLGVEHGVLDDVDGEGGELVGAPETLGKRYLLGERRAHGVGERAEQRRVEDPGCDGDHADAELGEIPRDRQRHSDDPALGRRVGRLADLSVEGGHRRGVDDDAPLAIGGRGIPAHRSGGQANAVEGADEIDLDDPREVLQLRWARAAHRLHRGADARAVDQHVDAAEAGAGLLDGVPDLVAAGHVARDEGRAVPQLARDLGARRGGQMGERAGPAAVDDPCGRRAAQPRGAAGDDGVDRRQLHENLLGRCSAPTSVSWHCSRAAVAARARRTNSVMLSVPRMRTRYAPRSSRKILCVFPRYAPSFGTFQHAYPLFGRRARAFMPPQGLLVVAAYLPERWQVRFVDENIASARPDDFEWADAVLVSGMHVQRPHIHDVIRRAHAPGRPVVLGGPSVSGCPEYYPDADILHLGELGDATDAVIRRLDEGVGRPAAQLSFETTERLPLADFPQPAYRVLALRQYFIASVQFSSGCPYLCEFCDIPTLYGRNPRLKRPEQVLAELDEIAAAGATSVYFVDDNFIGNVRATLELLPHLIEWQARRNYPL